MGSTSTHRPTGVSHRDFFGRLYAADTEILECATIRSTFYAAVKDTATGRVFALVVPFGWAPRSHHNFTYKTMDETVGPVQAHAPAKVLDLLTPTDSTYANEWRTRCREHLARTNQAPALRRGARVVFDTAWEFANGDVSADFIFVGRHYFRSIDTGLTYRITGYKQRPYRVVGAASPAAG